jgi:DNA-binding XRE family transcriptional regulator
MLAINRPVKEARMEAKLTQGELAEKTGKDLQISIQ